MLLVLSEGADVSGGSRAPECTFTIPQVVLPTTFVAFAAPIKMITLACPATLCPLPYIEVSAVVKASATSIPQIFLPLAIVLVVRPLISIAMHELALPIAQVPLHLS